MDLEEVKETLFEACEAGNQELIEQILSDQNIPVSEVINCKNEEGRTPLHVAVSYGYLQVVQILLKQKEIKVNLLEDDEYLTPLAMACLDNEPKLVSCLLSDERVEVNRPNLLNTTPIWFVAKFGLIEVLEVFFASRRQIDWDRKGRIQYFDKATTPFEAAQGSWQILISSYFNNPKKIR